MPNNPAVSVARLPYWLNAQQRHAISHAITVNLETGQTHPRHQPHLDAVLMELGVAAARDQVWPDAANLVRRAAGYAPDVLPVHMSKDELHAVLALADLPADTRTHLKPTTKA